MMSQLDDDALPPGTVVGGCQLLEPVSADGMSILYLVNDTTLQRDVLIREHFPTHLVERRGGSQVTLREGADSQDRAHALEAFLQEARLLVRLDHPSIAKVHRFWEANHTAYMMMPFYQGETLAAVLQRANGPVGEDWLRGLMLSLLGALEALHQTGCYHLDLSPERIWITPEGLPVLLDLSSANKVRQGRHAVDETQSGVDRLYAPLEQFSHGQSLPLGPWTDIYALAAVAHHALVGGAPTSAAVLCEDDRLVPLAEALTRRGRRYAEAGYSAAFLAAIDRALSVRPQGRFQNAAEFEAALRASSAGVDAPVEEKVTYAESPQPSVVTAARDDTSDEGQRIDPAAAAAIAMAISSLPWVSRNEPVRHEPVFGLGEGVSMPEVLRREDSNTSSANANEPAFARDASFAASAQRAPEQAPADERDDGLIFPSATVLEKSDEVWLQPTLSSTHTRPAPAARPPSRAGRWVVLSLVLASVVGLGWYGHENPQIVARVAQAIGLQAEPVPAAGAAAPAAVVAPSAVGASGALEPQAAAAPTVSGADLPDPPVRHQDSGAVAAAEPLDPFPPVAQPAASMPEASAPAAPPGRVRGRAESKPAGTPTAAATEAPVAPATPRGVCGNRTNFALVYCMQTQCNRPGFSRHAQCVAFRQDGEVK